MKSMSGGIITDIYIKYEKKIPGVHALEDDEFMRFSFHYQFKFVCGAFVIEIFGAFIETITCTNHKTMHK